MTDILQNMPGDLSQALARNRRLFEDYLATFASLRFDEWAERFWRPDGQFVVAYPVGGGSPIVGADREQILQNMKMLGSIVSFIRIDGIEITQTSDPNQFIARHQIHADYKNGTYRNDLLSIVTLSEGKIIRLVEYYNAEAYHSFLKAIGAAS
jgi:ketosteroid isomerase-like protein